MFEDHIYSVDGNYSEEPLPELTATWASSVFFMWWTLLYILVVGEKHQQRRNKNKV
jgi:hypothetical protein